MVTESLEIGPRRRRTEDRRDLPLCLRDRCRERRVFGDRAGLEGPELTIWGREEPPIHKLTRIAVKICAQI